ncbi:low temperature requirement protein A [Herbiconiux sp. CPCC 205763]|uniref:Low temperature requirement protein A n=1 Tax=Herbiconiux aconitum TaxID=2970913 RepID=A0ABT2GQS2_9MICO|nr:low temperature requirement protein A [Herbiconiux aconitum]MCS5718476.1 low temperature requirement protein A [Herbiconiux aconitum]
MAAPLGGGSAGLARPIDVPSQRGTGFRPMTAAPESKSSRGAHWLELFFDLVMVAYISQIAHTLHGDPSWTQTLAFFAFLAIAWWAWVNATITMNLFGARITPMIWITVTLGMVALGVMAASVAEATTDRAAAFALGNAAIRLVWVFPWLKNRRASGAPWWRPILYSVVPASLWLVSIFTAPPWQYVLWATALAIEIAILSFLGRSKQTWLNETLNVEHLSERVGLLVVIVFGESILTIISELDSHWSATSALTGFLGFAAVSMLAWIFFGRASSGVTLGLRRLQLAGSVGGIRDTVMYLPFVLVAGVAMFASALGTAVAEAGHHLPQGAALCLGAGISLFFLASAAESLRYGAPWRDVAIWAPTGIVLPWILVPLAASLPAEAVIAASVVIIAVLVVLTEISTRRLRTRRDERELVAES